MIHFDHIAVLRMVFLSHHHATRCGQDRRAAVGLKINPRMLCGAARDRVNAPAKHGTIVGLRNRRLGRHHHVANLLIKQAGLQHRHPVSALLAQALQVLQSGFELFDRQRPSGHQRTTQTGLRLDFIRIDTSQTRDPLAERLELRHLGLHFTELACQQIQVLAHETITLLKLILDDHPDQRTDHWPALPGPFQEDPVVQAGSQQRHHD